MPITEAEYFVFGDLQEIQDNYIELPEFTLCDFGDLSVGTVKCCSCEEYFYTLEGFNKHTCKR